MSLRHSLALLCLTAIAGAQEPKPSVVETVAIEGTDFRFTVETTEAPDLSEWARTELIPALKIWYPKIVAMLPSEGFTAPKTFSIVFTDAYKGVAATMGTRIEGNPGWYRGQLKGEAVGSMVHELVHVVQQYRGRRDGGKRPPGWLVEGLADYIRWMLYEPQTRGAEISPRRAAKVRHDEGYRTSANFLRFVLEKYDKELVREFNAAMREGRYDVELWKTRTGKTVEELAEEWRASLGAAQS